MSLLQNIVPDDIATGIADRLSEVLTSLPPEYRTEDDLPSSFIPDAHQLRAATNAVFWASIEQEEGKMVLPRVAVGDLRELDCRIAPCALTPGALRKLSPFYDDGRNFLHCSGSLEITGIGPLDVLDLSIHAERPGTIVISHLHAVLAILEEGEWHLINRDAIGLAKALENLFSEDDQPFKRRKAYILIMMAMSARAAKRGALYVMTPPNAHAHLSLPPSYEVVSFNAGREALVEGAELDNVFNYLDEMWRYWRHSDAVNSLRERFAAVVSAGSGIDGATLLDQSDLRVVGFGVKINAPADDVPVQLLSFPRAPRTVDKKHLGGMRHQSAARLVQANHAATVVTVSQDGAISLFTWGAREGAVMVAKHLDRFLRAPSSGKMPT